MTEILKLKVKMGAHPFTTNCVSPEDSFTMLALTIPPKIDVSFNRNLLLIFEKFVALNWF